MTRMRVSSNQSLSKTIRLQRKVANIEDAYGYLRWKSAVKRLEDGSPAILPDWNVFENLRLLAGSETEYKPKRRRRVQSGAPLFAQIAA